MLSYRFIQCGVIVTNSRSGSWCVPGGQDTGSYAKQEEAHEMFARRLSRLCVLLAAAPGGLSRTVTRLCRQHAGVSAGWITYPGIARLPGVRTCIVHSERPYSDRVPDAGSSLSTDPDCGCAEDGPQRGPDQAPPQFNINVLVNLLRQENGKDLCVIRVPPEMKYADYFVVVGGTSTRHLQAMAQYTLQVYKFLKRENKPHVCLEGKDTDDWMCIDFGNIVVHYMLPETRETYELEKLWTLRSYDDQFSQISQEVLPFDFTLGLQQHKE
ncbi:mitochondrial assembly of ribosomal large subunit protein 1 [Bufo bufo]|uniref:mitochondrial assembly of ribosomal large subunit protein 1 n=1 Tax=Bufo bufo TaxID=8384 RepID=UPI001ABD9C9A|nr:mitochondrial assembly of ribosomal large subunit protein 1 [Bufo bufo]